MTNPDFLKLFEDSMNRIYKPIKENNMAFKKEEPKEEVKKPQPPLHPQPQGNEILIDTSNDPKAG